MKAIRRKRERRTAKLPYRMHIAMCGAFVAFTKCCNIFPKMEKPPKKRKRTIIKNAHGTGSLFVGSSCAFFSFAGCFSLTNSNFNTWQFNTLLQILSAFSHSAPFRVAVLLLATLPASAISSVAQATMLFHRIALHCIGYFWNIFLTMLNVLSMSCIHNLCTSFSNANEATAMKETERESYRSNKCTQNGQN